MVTMRMASFGFASVAVVGRVGVSWPSQATVLAVIDPELVDVHPEVADALGSGSGVVALESTIISHGLPPDTSAATARDIEGAVRRSGSVPATIAVLDGRIRLGLDDEALDRLATDPAIVKASVRDLAVVVASGGSGATTVASTSLIAAASGIDLFATGGLGGVHRGAVDSWDESADLLALATSPIAVVCAGVKSILDVAATLERLETLSVAVVGYQTDRFPGFYVRDSGQPVPWHVGSPQEVAQIIVSRRALGLPQALIVASPVPAEAELDPSVHDATLAAGLAALEAEGVSGKDVTPFLLAYFHEHTAGASLAANVALVVSNAALAGEVAAALAAARQS
jgi:pseudouridine-5'-phosphate glycosidase